MPRRPKPYKYRGWYVTDSGGVPHHKLCPVEKGMVEAEKELRRYLTRMDDEREKSPTPGPGIRPSTTNPDNAYGKKVHEAHDEFLDAKKADGEPLTYKHYVDKLLPFHERFGGRVVTSLTEADGVAYKAYLMNEKEWTKGKTKVKGLGACTVNHHLRAAKTFLNWCAKPGRRLITHNPWSDIKYLKEHGRERLVTDAEFATLLKHCVTCRYADRAEHPAATCSFCRSDDEFRQILVVMRHTTMRPGEAAPARMGRSGLRRPPRGDVPPEDQDPQPEEHHPAAGSGDAAGGEAQGGGRGTRPRNRPGVPDDGRRGVGARELQPAVPATAAAGREGRGNAG